MVEFLISHGADVNARDHHFNTPLICTESADTAEILIRNGADVNAVNDLGLTVLQSRILDNIINNRTDVFMVLVNNHADINAPFPENSGLDSLTPLMLAAASGNIDLAKILLVAGANVDAVDQDGRTAHKIARDNSQQQIAALIGSYILTRAKEQAKSATVAETESETREEKKLSEQTTPSSTLVPTEFAAAQSEQKQPEL
jgi:ankyrin repeat protein